MENIKSEIRPPIPMDSVINEPKVVKSVPRLSEQPLFQYQFGNKSFGKLDFNINFKTQERNSPVSNYVFGGFKSYKDYYNNKFDYYFEKTKLASGFVEGQIIKNAIPATKGVVSSIGCWWKGDRGSSPKMGADYEDGIHDI